MHLYTVNGATPTKRTPFFGSKHFVLSSGDCVDVNVDALTAHPVRAGHTVKLEFGHGIHYLHVTLPDYKAARAFARDVVHARRITPDAPTTCSNPTCTCVPFCVEDLNADN